MFLYAIVLTVIDIFDYWLTHGLMGGDMRTRNTIRDDQAMRRFATDKVLTVVDLRGLLSCSLVTVRRRLKEWDAYTSYNQNGRYYTLPAIPTFNKSGIWRYGDIYFSRYGTLKNTVIALAAKSPKGLNHAELEEIIGLNPKCFLARFEELPGAKKERYKNRVVYFSADPNTYRAQTRNRFPPDPSTVELPPDAEAIIILVELIHHPGMGIDELAAQLQHKGHAIEADTIGALFKRYRIEKKKPNTKS